MTNVPIMTNNYLDGYTKALERAIELLEDHGKFGLDKVVKQLKEEIQNVQTK